jgi:hypothetical protein
LASQCCLQQGRSLVVVQKMLKLLLMSLLVLELQVTHPDLAANIWFNTADAADGADNDANGYVDDINGWDFCNNDK